jgi:hypothetical protein
MCSRNGSSMMQHHSGETRRKRKRDLMGSREKMSNNISVGNCPPTAMLVLLEAFEGRCQGFRPNINYTIYFLLRKKKVFLWPHSYIYN